MKGSDIKIGETYFFVGTDSPTRKHLEGTEFFVADIKKVWRKNRGGNSQKLNRYFNEFGEGARAEELEPLGDQQIYNPENQERQDERQQFTGEIKESDFKDDDQLPF